MELFEQVLRNERQQRVLGGSNFITHSPPVRVVAFWCFWRHCVIWHYYSIAAIVVFVVITAHESFPPRRHFSPTQRVDGLRSRSLAGVATPCWRCRRCEFTASRRSSVFMTGRQYKIRFWTNSTVTRAWRWCHCVCRYLTLWQRALVTLQGWSQWSRTVGRPDTTATGRTRLW